MQLDPAMPGPDHTSGSERPSSACHISGGRSSMTTDMPTWLTGLLVATWIARSAMLLPAEQPHVAGAGQVDGLVQGDARGGHGLA